MVHDFLAGLDVDQMYTEQLLQLLATWSPKRAANLGSADRDMILGALEDYLDPDGDNLVAVFSWNTLEERGTIGFYVDRRKNENDAWTRINNDKLPGVDQCPHGRRIQAG